MKLDLFLIDFFQTGQATMQQEINDLDEESLSHSILLLAEYHRADSLHMPFSAPNFHSNAALWAAKYIYYSLQLVLLRDIELEQIQQLLVDYDGTDTAEEIYSADLMLRFLPDVLKLANGLSPEDPLVYKLKETAAKWPFSSVGMEGLRIGTMQNIFVHPSLRQAYIDRVITKKDISRIKGEEEMALLKEVLGMHEQTLWPNLNLMLNEENI